MKILHVIPSIDPATGGPVEGIKQFCRIFHSAGNDVDVATLDAPDAAKGFDFPAPVIGLGPGWGVYGYSPHATPWFRDNIRNYDVVIINCIWQYNAVAAFASLRGTGIPYAVFAHGMLDPYFKEHFPFKHIKKSIYWHLFLRKILHEASKVFFTCEEEKILARRSFPRYQVNEAVIPYGIFGLECDTAAAKSEFLACWPQLGGKRLAISLGRIHPKKATDVLIEAFAKSLAGDPAWELVIAGPDETGWKKDLQSLAERLGMANRVTWTGMLKGSLKWGAFAASEVFVLPSHQENFGIVVAEALACNLPVVLSSKVNIWREVEGHKAGLICEDSVEGAARALAHWARLTESEIEALRLHARECFDDIFNYTTNAKRVLESIEELARRRQNFKSPSA